MEPEPYETYTVVGRPDCPWCVKAKEFLRDHGVHHTYYDLSQHPETREFLKLLGCSTVPLVFYGAELIGGYEELEGWLGPLD